MTGAQAERGKDLRNHGGAYDPGDLQGTAAMGAVFEVDLEHAFTKRLPWLHFGPAWRWSPC